MIAGAALLFLGLSLLAYVQIEIAAWDRTANTRRLEHMNDQMRRELGMRTEHASDLLKTSDEKFGALRWVSLGGAGLGGLLIIVGWAASPRKLPRPDGA